MGDYTLEVHFGADAKPRHTETITGAQQVLARIPFLLQVHSECERVVVLMWTTRLFSVDCKGNRLSD